MMQNHVPALETCKKLHELGFPQDNCKNYWSYWEDGPVEYAPMGWKPFKGWIVCRERYGLGDETGQDAEYAAPLATELLEWLPKYLRENAMEKNEEHYKLYLMPNSLLWQVSYSPLIGCIHTHPLINDNNLSEALAQMLIYLVENKIVSFEKEKDDK